MGKKIQIQLPIFQKQKYSIGFLYSYLIGLIIGKFILFIKKSSAFGAFSLGNLFLNNMNIYILKSISG